MAIKNKNQSGINSLQNQYRKTENVPAAKADAAAEQMPDKARQENKADKKSKKYLRLDITDYQEYISLMTGYEKTVNGKYISMTQYILQLIEADKQKNKTIFEKLEQIEKMKQELI